MAGELLKTFVDKYRVELERLNYGRVTINVYLRSMHRLGLLMEEHSVAVGELTPDIAAELVLRRLARRSTPVCELHRLTIRWLSRDVRRGKVAGAAYHK